MTARTCLLVTFLFINIGINAQQPDPPGQVADPEKAVNEACLFAHMTFFCTNAYR